MAITLAELQVKYDEYETWGVAEIWNAALDAAAQECRPGLRGYVIKRRILALKDLDHVNNGS